MRHVHFKLSAAFAALLAFSATAQAPGDVRIALVIGNAAYAGAAALVNPANDAAAMTGALKTLGFTVTELKDGSRSQMAEAISRVRDNLKGKQGIGMLYYAGHGLQVDFRNYMVPVDAKLDAAGSVAAQTLDIGQVIDAFKAAGNRMNILVLDACRDNPFAGQASGKGLAPLDAPSGTFLAYATAPGNVAEDGDAGAGNGLYTGYLVKELQKPAARIEDVFKRVRLQVRQKSQGRQIPWESTSLEEDFFFNDGVTHTFRPADLERIARAGREKEQKLLALADQTQQTQQRERQDALKELERLKAAEVARAPEMKLAEAQATESARLKRLSPQESREQAFRAEQAEWAKVSATRNPADLYAFLQKYPTGFTSELAQFRLDQLEKIQLQPQAGADGVVQLASGTRRYRVGDRLVYSQKDVYGKALADHQLHVTDMRGSQVVINGGAEIWDEMGNLVTDSNGTRNPPKGYFPADLSTGKTWRSAYSIVAPNGFVTSLYWDFTVKGIETVTVPAGIFKAYRVEGTSRTATGIAQTETYWIDPATFLMIKDDWVRRSGSQVTGSYQRELVSYARGKTAARTGPIVSFAQINRLN
jgi:uncharacterized caspase-like protein